MDKDTFERVKERDRQSEYTWTSLPRDEPAVLGSCILLRKRETLVR